MFVFPKIVHANGLDDSVAKLMGRVYEVIINPLITLMFALALMLFLFGMLKFFIGKGQGNDTKSQEGRQHMLWGIVGMFIMASVFTIMRLLINTIGSDVQI